MISEVRPAAREPKTVQFYDAGHELDEAATKDRLEWLKRVLKIG